MKKLALSILCTACIIGFTACGHSGETSSAEKIAESMDLPEEGMHGYSGSAGEALQNVTDNNYIDIAQGIFGIDVALQDGWTLKSATSPNKVNNLKIVYEIADADADINAITKSYYDQCLAIATDGVYAVKMDYNTGAVNRGEKYADYESYKAQSGGMDMWSYDYNGQTIQFTFSSWKKQVEITFVLTSK